MRRIALALGIVLLAAVWAVVDPAAGVRTWWDLRSQLGEAEARAAKVRTGLAELEGEAERLEADPLAVEAAIRADLGLARPGETIVRAVAPAARPSNP
jgi:cell division protein FtsB